MNKLYSPTALKQTSGSASADICKTPTDEHCAASSGQNTSAAMLYVIH